MRAVAVLAVMAAHAGVPGLRGGFVGVDVFFVVSGFLITGLMLRSVATSGRFSLTEFYARRARRILPAATVVLVLTLLASVLYLTFLDALDATKDAIWAALFVANVRFAQEGVDYFALGDSPSPFQHYWSLAVEEQFYLLWPLLFGLVVLATRRRRRRGEVPATLLALVVLVVSAASLAWSVHRTEVEPAAAYFSSLTRAWELGLGCLVAIVVWTGRSVPGRLVRELLALLGLVGIVYACITYDESMAFPGYEALLPVLATAALLLAGASYGAERSPTDPVGTRTGQEPLVSRVLAVRPLRDLGDWSFSLYLWHWPAIVVPKVTLGRDLTVTETVIALAVTVELAYLTYRFVEQPFRSGRRWRVPLRGLVLYPLSLALVVPVALGGQAYSQWAGSERGHDPAVTPEAFGIASDEDAEVGGTVALVQASAEAARADFPIPSDLTPDLIDLSDDLADVGECNYMKPERPLCRRGDTDADQVMVVTGDSHARAWIPALEEIAQRAGYATYYLVKQQCTAAFVDPGRLGSGDRWPECEEFHDWVVDQVTELQPDLMIVATSPPPTGVWTDEGEFVRDREGLAQELVGGYDDMFATYEPLVDRMVLLSDVPRLPKEPSTCLATPGHTMGDCAFAPTSFSEEMRQVSIAAAVRAGVDYIDPTPWLCSDDLCPVVIGSTIAYRDRGHISATRAAELWLALGDELGLLRDPNDTERRRQSVSGRSGQ